MTSLRTRITLLWAVLAAVCVAMLFVLRSAEQAGPDALVARAEADTRDACGTIARSVSRLVPTSDDGNSPLMEVVVDVALREAYGIEGGVWDATHGDVAYAYPTYEGAVRKTDVPAAELPTIRALARQVAADGAPRLDARRGNREAVVIAACALPRHQVAWTLTRVAAAQAQAFQHLTVAAAIALGLVVLAGAWLLMGLRLWSRKLAALEQEIAGRGTDTARIATRGEADLDRLVLAFNTSAARIDTLNADSERLARELAQADRLSSLGRVAAGLAHEIRNPLGAMRLRAENALAFEGAGALERRGGALAAVLSTVDRIDALVTSLLELTRPIEPARRPTSLAPWLQEAIAFRAEQAEHQGVDLNGECEPALTAEIDGPALARALDNLLLNALQHTPRGGRIAVRIAADGAAWRLQVDDTGPGVAAAMQPRLFEPFATGRPQGTGLGLASAHEIVSGHGGVLTCATAPGGGARFDMELPWRAS